MIDSNKKKTARTATGKHSLRMRFIGRRSHPLANGKRFISMRVKFVAMAVITGVSVISAALLVIFLIFALVEPRNRLFVLVAGGLSAVAVFLLVMLIYYHRQIRAMVLLSREVERVSEAHPDTEITTTRNDEIGQLAEDVERLRQTILEKVAEKEAVWQASSDLLTSMTHDIRTPLTSLLGYMDLLSKDETGLTEEQRNYLRICTRKAQQIKDLSDKLFLYFWAYNRADAGARIETEPYACALLMEQLIGDYLPAMEAEGFSVRADLSAIHPEDQVWAEIEYLRRVTDNVFGNIVKYADPADPVCITAEREPGRIRVRFANRVGRRREQTSGTRIGVKTCVYMMEQLGGSFETEEGEGSFAAILVFPAAE